MMRGWKWKKGLRDDEERPKRPNRLNRPNRPKQSMASWLIFAASCVGFWGVWGFVAKLTTMRGVHPLALSAVSSITAGLTAWATFYVIGAPWE